MRLLKAITRCIAKDAGENIFCTSQSISSDSLAVEIKNCGKIKFPVMPKVAKKLIAQARPAKYGFKDKTLYDPEVRSVWEITPSEICILSENWHETLTKTLKTMAFDLNIPKDCTLTPHLHNMVIYGPGQFFASHQDSEKYPGMVASLVVLFPSRFRGGKLVIDHHGIKKEFGAPVEEKISLITFYADCHHQVEPVTSGFRVALTYNLVMQKPKIVTPTDHSQELVDALQDYFTAKTIEGLPDYEQDTSRWLVFLLDHQYTQKSLSWQLLKGSDRDYVGKFLAAAAKLDLEPHLALADIHETWSAESDESSYHWDSEYGDDELDSEDIDDIELGELVVDECTLNHWIDRDGNPLSFGAKYISDSMICWAKSTSEFDPFESEHEGYMGNYGNTVDKWYHRAAIVLWPKSRQISSLFNIDSSLAFKEIQERLKKDLQSGHKAIEQILPQLQKSRLEDETSISSILGLALLAKDRNLATKLTANVSLDHISKSAHKKLTGLLELYGEAWVMGQLQHWGKTEKRSHAAFLRDFDDLTEMLRTNSPKIVKWLLNYQLEQIKSRDDYAQQQGSAKVGENGGHRKSLEELFFAAQFNIEFIDSVVGHILKLSDLYSPIALGKIAVSLQGRISEKSARRVFLDFLTEVESQLKAVAEKGRASDDWSILQKPICKCSDCANLSRFLKNATQQKLVWPIAKDRRQHIHRTIDALDIPVTHVTKREGSPQKLILTKTNQLFTNHRQLQKDAADLLKKLS